MYALIFLFLAGKALPPRLKGWVALLLVSACLTSCANLNFADGYAAYQRGNYATALRVFRPLANEGYAGAQTNLGLMYANGQGVPQDAAEAVRWYRKAADQGQANAQGNLGWMYANGEGVPKDAAEAVRWYRLALQNSVGLTVEWKKRVQEAINRLEQAAPAASAMTTSAPTIHIPRGPRISLQAGEFTLEGVASGAGVVEVMINDEVVAQTKDQQAKELAFSYRRYFTVGETVLRVTATNWHGQASTQTVTIIRVAKPR